MRKSNDFVELASMLQAGLTAQTLHETVVFAHFDPDLGRRGLCAQLPLE